MSIYPFFMALLFSAIGAAVLAFGVGWVIDVVIKWTGQKIAYKDLEKVMWAFFALFVFLIMRKAYYGL